MVIFQILFAILAIGIILSVIIVFGVVLWAALREEQDDINDDPRV
jgi:site-specific recombinase